MEGGAWSYLGKKERRVRMEGEFESERLARESAAAAAGGAARCPHGRVRSLERCVDCWASLLKESRRIVARCKADRRGRRLETCVPCEHCAEKRRCRVCKGSWVCVHDKNKVYCKVCDGRRLCQVCFDVTLPRCYEACKRCRAAAERVAAQRGETLEAALRSMGYKAAKH